MAGAAVAARRIAAVDLADMDEDQMVEKGLLDAGDVTFDHDPVPGEVIFDMNVDGTKEGRFDGTMTGDDPTHVAIYDVQGRRFTMPRDWALLRLMKRYPKNHRLAGKPVFYKRPPAVFPLPTFPCPVQTCNEGRGKMLYTLRQQETHFKRRHPEDFQEREAERSRDLQERAIVAQERTALLLEKLITNGVNPAAVEAAVATEEVVASEEPKAELTAAVPDLPFPDGLPTEKWSRKELADYLKHNDLALLEGWHTKTQAALWEHTRTLLGLE